MSLQLENKQHTVHAPSRSCSRRSLIIYLVSTDFPRATVHFLPELPKIGIFAPALAEEGPCQGHEPRQSARDMAEPVPHGLLLNDGCKEMLISRWSVVGSDCRGN